MLYYILAEDGKTPIATQDMVLWGQYMEANGWHIADTRDADKGIRVSTIFLGINHNLWGSGPPVLFETIVEKGGKTEYMRRYTTWDQAERGHKVACGIAGIAWMKFEDNGSMTA